MTPEAVLGPAIAAAVRELVRQEMDARPVVAPQAPARRMVTVPAASKATGVSVVTIRGPIHGGRIPVRLAGARPVRSDGRSSSSWTRCSRRLISGRHRQPNRWTSRQKAARLRARAERGRE